MPINASPEYYKAEEKFRSAKTKEDKIIALEEMIRVLPKHKGVEHLLAALRSKLAKLKKEPARKSGRAVGIKKEGDAQVCLIGYTNAGKSTLLRQITDAKPLVAPYDYTTTVPIVGMMTYKGVNVQVIEIPATFAPQALSIARTADLIVLVVRTPDEVVRLRRFLADHFVSTRTIVIERGTEPGRVMQLIWGSLGLIAVKTQKTKTAMAMPVGSTVKDCAGRIHKDFVKNFRIARLWRTERGKTGMRQVGLSYVLQDGDVIEILTQ